MFLKLFCNSADASELKLSGGQFLWSVVKHFPVSNPCHTAFYSLEMC